MDIYTRLINIASRSEMLMRHGCLIIDDKNNIISTGYNHNRYHAEADAISKLKVNGL
jgi:deoxycytidylate deaminase